MNSALLNFILLIFLSISDTLAENTKLFKYKTEITNVLQSLGFSDVNNILNNASDQCLSSIENTHECFEYVNNLLIDSNKNTQKYEDICYVFNSQSCDYFRNFIVPGKSGCDNQYEQKYFSLNFDMSLFHYYSICSKNKENKYCPAVDFYRTIISNDISKATDNNKEQIVKQSSNDKNCVDQMKKIISLTPSVLKIFDLTYPKSGETQESLNQIKNALDVKAMDKAIKTVNDNASSAMTNKLSITSLTIIIIICSLFVIF
ncbi:hypothetical protein PIROE2DRAFT_3227 [Piromyces sp. E2]|nr:hypothetical protein PIROE2DRAFT_3227 [Piromyces sp. E2]|eukprot:OUM68991.1 hypothetical protein PIROE2DRAFT_3227 [Piromyces sp. E2]